MKTFILLFLISVCSVPLVEGRMVEFDRYEICEELDYLSTKQIEVLYFSFEYGYKFDFGYTMAAIALQESHAGDIPINLQDPSAGIFHVTMPNAINYMEWRDTPYNRNRLTMMMINSPMLSADMALDRLKFWERQKGKGNWFSIWASYNGGWKGNEEYARKIADHINVFKSCHLFKHLEK